MKESDLAYPVAEWLRLNDYTVYSEIPFWNRCIDMVGLAGCGNQVRVVELKLGYCKGGLLQAKGAQIATEDVWLAVGNNPRPKSIELCRRYGVGLLKVTNQVEVLLEPIGKMEPLLAARIHVVQNCISAGPSDEAGLPCLSGCSPARFVGDLVQEYVRNYPKAGWKEIYINVPSHYSNYKSMARVMSSYLGLSLRELRKEKK